MAKNALLNLNEINKSHRKFIKKSTDDIATSLEKVAIKFFQQLQTHTARDTSRAINGWIPTIDKSASEWKPKKGLPFYAPLSFPKGQIKYYSYIWIANNVEYIEYLDGKDGKYSMQYPEGFTTPAFRNTLLFLNREIAKLNGKKYNV